MPNERNTNQRPSFLQRGRDSLNAWRQRQVQGARNATPGHQGWGWQLADMLSEPFIGGNLYNSQAAPGERRFQFPGESAVRGIGSGIRGLFDRPNPGYTPGAGMGIMPNPSGWNPSQPQGESINIQPEIPGTLPQGQGPLREYQSPGGAQRPQLDQFVLMREAPGWGAMMAHLNALYSDQNRRRQK